MKPQKKNPQLNTSVTDSSHSADTKKVSEKVNETDVTARIHTSTSNHQFESNKNYFTISIYVLSVVAISTIFIYLIANFDKTKAGIRQFLSVLSPFFVAFFLAYLLYPLIRKLETFYKKVCHLQNNLLRKVLAILTGYILVLVIITIVLFYITPQISKSLNDLIEKIPTMYTEIYNYLSTLQKRFPEFDFGIIEQKLIELRPQIIDFGTNMVTNIIPLIYTISVSIVKTFINILLSIVISCYMISDKNNLAFQVKRFVFAVLPKEKAESLCETSKECNNIFSGFIIGKTIDSLIIGIICFILLSIFDFDYAILLSVIVGITNMIPYFGPFIGAIPGILIFLFIDPVRAFFFGIIILILQQFDGLILGPKILGDSTGLKPLWVIFGITVGGAYGGVLGMFLGVPIVAVISFLLNKFITNRLKKKNCMINNKTSK